MNAMDDIELKILSEVQRSPGENIATLLRSFCGLDWTTGHQRCVKTLARDGYLKLQKTRAGRVLVFPLEPRADLCVLGRYMRQNCSTESGLRPLKEGLSTCDGQNNTTLHSDSSSKAGPEPMEGQVMMVEPSVTSCDVEMIKLNKKVERLQAIIDLYIRPVDEIFSEDDIVRADARRAVARRIQKDRDAIESIPGIKEDLEDNKAKFDKLMQKRKPGELTQKRLKRTDDLLVARKNEPIPFSEMKRLQEFKPKHRSQDMTKLGHVYEQIPERYEVSQSSLGGKKVKLVRSYFNHLTRREV